MIEISKEDFACVRRHAMFNNEREEVCSVAAAFAVVP